MSEPAVLKSRPKLRRYLLLSLVLLPFTVLADLALRLQNADLHARVLEFSTEIGQSVEALDPFALAKAFYNRLSESDYTWRPLQWDAPFNLTEARRRFREEHPGCPAPSFEGFDSDPGRIFQHLRPTPVTLGQLGGDQLLKPGATGSQAWALLNEPSPTPGTLAGGLLQAKLDPSGTDLYQALSLATPTPWPSLLRSPTPRPSLAERIQRESGLTPVLTISMCTEEQSREAESLRQSPLVRFGIVHLLLGLPDATFEMARQAKAGLDGGLASALVVLMVLFCGAALFLAVIETHPLMLLVLPLLAGLGVWVLLLPVRLALALFPHALSAVELFAFVATLPPVLWLIQIAFAVAQTAAVEKAMEAQDRKPEA